MRLSDVDQIHEKAAADVEDFCAKHGLAESTFGRLATGNWRLLPKVREGNITLETLRKIYACIRLFEARKAMASDASASKADAAASDAEAA